MSESSQEVAIFQPAYLRHTVEDMRNLMLTNLGSNFKGSINDLPKIKVPSGGGTQWKFDTAMGTKYAESIEGIIVKFTETRDYWETEEQERPTCASDDALTGVGDPGGDCLVCPLAQFEPVPKCSEKRQLFVVGQKSFIPSIITVPPASLTNFRKLQTLAFAEGISFDNAVIKFSLMEVKGKGKQAYSQIVFEVVQVLDPDSDQALQAQSYKKMINDTFGTPERREIPATEVKDMDEIITEVENDSSNEDIEW